MKKVCLIIASLAFPLACVPKKYVPSEYATKADIEANRQETLDILKDAIADKVNELAKQMKADYEASSKRINKLVDNCICPNTVK